MKAARNPPRHEPRRSGNVLIVATMLISLCILSLVKARYCSAPYAKSQRLAEAEALEASGAAMEKSEEAALTADEDEEPITAAPEELAAGKAVSMSNKPICSQTSKRSDVCQVEGDVRLQGSSQIIFLPPYLTDRARLSSMGGRAFFLALRRSLSLPVASPLTRLRPLLAALPAGYSVRLRPAGYGFRCFSTRPTTSSLNDPSPNWSNRPPKETILLDGCDFEHWLIVMEPPDPSLTRDEIIDGYIKTLAEVLDSEEEARMSIYSVSTKHYFAFGCKVSEEISYKIKPLQNVRWVLPDSYLDVKNKDYGGEPFIDGKAVPYDPKYHEEWVRNNARAQERSRRNDRPRNFDRSRNFERRRENMQNFQNREAPPFQNQEFQNIPSQNTTQHTPQAPPPPVRDGGTPNFQSQMPPNAHSQQGYVPTYQGGSQGYQGGPGGPGYQGDQGFQSGFSRPSYPRGNPAGPPTGYQVNYQGGSSARPGPDAGYQGGSPSGYQGGTSARPGPDTGYQGGSPSGYQGGSSARPGPDTGYQGGSPSGYQGGSPSGYQGGSSVPTNTYPGGYQGGAPAYRGGSPSGHQGFDQPYQGQGVASDYQPPNSRYQGGNQGNQGGGGDQGEAPIYPGRDLPGRDQ